MGKRADIRRYKGWTYYRTGISWYIVTPELFHPRFDTIQDVKDAINFPSCHGD